MTAGSSQQGRRGWAGVIVPLALLLALLADGASRFLSLDRFSIRSWEAMSRNAFTEGGIPFEPSKRYERARAFGDLAASMNRPRLREYRREIFTSDAAGYRNAMPPLPGQPPDAILVGSSFSVGSGVSDDQTLAVRLGQLTGRRIYNAAGGIPSPERIREIARRLGMKRGTVLLELLESKGFPERPPAVPRLHRECVDRLGVACLRIKGWLRASPLQIVAQRAYRLLEDDVWLPNVSAGELPPPRLANGTVMLFGERVTASCPGIGDAAAREYFRWFRDGLAGLDLLVFVVPGKYSVYGELSDVDALARARTSARPPASASDAGSPPERCGKRIAATTAELGIPLVDLTEPLREAARARLAANEYVYFLDDTHWNAHGIDVAARALAERWPRPR